MTDAMRIEDDYSYTAAKLAAHASGETVSTTCTDARLIQSLARRDRSVERLEVLAPNVLVIHSRNGNVPSSVLVRIER